MADRHRRGKDIVSLVELMANPDRFDGKNVFVIGYFSSDNDGSYLFLSKDDCEYCMLPSAIEIRGRSGRNFDQFDRQYVAFCGRYRSNVRGDQNDFTPGVIEDATFYQTFTRICVPRPPQSGGK